MGEVSEASTGPAWIIPLYTPNLSEFSQGKHGKMQWYPILVRNLSGLSMNRCQTPHLSIIKAYAIITWMILILMPATQWLHVLNNPKRDSSSEVLGEGGTCQNFLDFNNSRISCNECRNDSLLSWAPGHRCGWLSSWCCSRKNRVKHDVIKLFHLNDVSKSDLGVFLWRWVKHTKTHHMNWSEQAQIYTYFVSVESLKKMLYVQSTQKWKLNALIWQHSSSFLHIRGGVKMCLLWSMHGENTVLICIPLIITLVPLPSCWSSAHRKWNGDKVDLQMCQLRFPLLCGISWILPIFLYLSGNFFFIVQCTQM